MTYKYQPKTTDELLAHIEAEIALQGITADLNCIDTSCIVDMVGLFEHSEFNGDISCWDTSNVTDMSFMFANSDFNGDICNFNTSMVTDMSFMFSASVFDNDISKWDVGNVTNMIEMFTYSHFSGYIWSWDLKSLSASSKKYIDYWKYENKDKYNALHAKYELDLLNNELKESPMYKKSKI